MLSLINSKYFSRFFSYNSINFSQFFSVASFTTLLLKILLSLSQALILVIMYVPIHVHLKLLIMSHISGAFGTGPTQPIFHNISKASAFDNW